MAFAVPHRLSASVGAVALVAALAACTPETPASDDNGGEINISRFAFRDLNRNGRYDLGERPYAGLEVELTRPGRESVTRASNIGGFTNFRLALGKKDREIDSAGELTFTALAPAGWTITTPDVAARTMAIKKPGSPGGLVVDPLLPLVGVAPDLSIAGAAGPGATVRLTAPDGRVSDIVADERGAFAAPVAPGEWLLDRTPGDGANDAKRIAVGEWAVWAARPIPNAPAAKPKTMIADFDGLTPSDTLFEIPDGYAGVGWRNFVATHQKLYRSDGYINAATSGEYVAYNSSGHPAWIGSDVPFDFVGAQIGVAWPGGEQADIVVTAFRGNEKVAEERLRGRTEGAVWFDAGWNGVTRVEFRHEAYWQIVFDDVTLRVD